MPERARSSPRRQRAPRLWRITPALARAPNESFEGVSVLDDFSGPFGLLLFHTVRDVLLWAEVPPETRTGLFAPGAVQRRRALLRQASREMEIDAGLSVALGVLTALVAEPGTGDGAAIMPACLQVSFWAESAGGRATAAAFAQAAAAAAPTSAESALRVGEMEVLRGHDVRAETWLRRAISLARRSRERSAYTDAVLELGRVLEKRGRVESARELFARAHRASRRYVLREARARAAAGLFRIAFAAGDMEAAERHVRRAMRVLGKLHPDRPDLLRALADVRLERGDGAGAVRALKAALSTGGEPETRMRDLARLARAAAQAGHRLILEESWTDAWLLVEQNADHPDAEQALVDLTHAAAEGQNWPRMRRAAERALELAREAGRKSVLLPDGLSRRLATDSPSGEGENSTS